MSVCVSCFLCVHSHFVSPHPQILNFPGSYFSLNGHDSNSRKWSELRSTAVRRGGLLGWLEWNGFAMVTAGKGQGKEVVFFGGGSAAISILDIYSLRGIMRLSVLQPEFTAAVNEHGVASAWLVK